MKTIKYLQKFENLEIGLDNLKSELGIEAKVYEEERLVCLNYSQIDSPKMDGIVKECRGLILDFDLNPVCRPFERFFNFGEGGSENFNFKGSTAYNKEDGSLVKVYFWDNEWRIGTRGTAFAEGPQSSSGTFFDHISKLLDFDKLCGYRHCTFLFEWVSPINRIVTPYENDALILLGVINTKDGYEVPEIYKRLKDQFLQPQSWYINTLEDCYSIIENMKTLKEGLVVVDQRGNRVKIKKESYVALHHMRGNGLTEKSICKLILENEHEEYLIYFPEERKYFQPFIEKYHNKLEYISKTYDIIKHIEDQKQFASKVMEVDKDNSSFYFSMRKYGYDSKDTLASFSGNKQLLFLIG